MKKQTPGNGNTLPPRIAKVAVAFKQLLTDLDICRTCSGLKIVETAPGTVHFKACPACFGSGFRVEGHQKVSA